MNEKSVSGEVTTSAILDIQGATVFRGQTKVFGNLNLTIESGTHTAIVGPNGAGKTTLLKLLARELYAGGGKVNIYGRQLWNVWELRRHLGIVSADLQRNYSPGACGESVILSGYYASIDTFGHQTFSEGQLERAHVLASELSIEHLARTPFARMSTGERRRHLLARALVHDPEALILDEPTSGLDLKAQFQYLDLIRGMLKQGKTLILVTHQIHEIPPEVGQVVLLKEGVVLAAGSKERILNSANLTQLFDVPVDVSENNGFYHASPG